VPSQQFRSWRDDHHVKLAEQRAICSGGKHVTGGNHAQTVTGCSERKLEELFASLVPQEKGERSVQLSSAQLDSSQND
jgi:hypothetical protein